MTATLAVRPISPRDRAWVLHFLQERWGSDRMVAHGQLFYPARHHGFLALLDGNPTGVVTYRIEHSDCEVTLIDSGPQHRGLGTVLLQAVEVEARAQGCRRIWLVTTNDNLEALRFYQRRGFTLCALRAGSMAKNRHLKPEIPEVGAFGIPLRDELELEKLLS